VVVDDGSTDATWQILEAASGKIPELVPVKNPGPHGFGRAIQKGLATASGDAMVIMMADESDDCRDVVRLNDTTNAFKAYRREVIEGCLPILSPRFNITVELPLKAIVRGPLYSRSVASGRRVAPAGAEPFPRLVGGGAAVSRCGFQIGRPDLASRSAASLAIAARSPPKRSEISRRMRCNSSMIDSGFG
jgi:glycosyltransferase involved in cell wall biosynthesis